MPDLALFVHLVTVVDNDFHFYRSHPSIFCKTLCCNLVSSLLNVIDRIHTKPCIRDDKDISNLLDCKISFNII